MNEERVIRDILVDVLNIANEEIDKIGMTDSLLDMGLDSITAIEMVVYLENHYEIHISDNDLFIEKIATIESIMQVIERNGFRNQVV